MGTERLSSNSESASAVRALQTELFETQGFDAKLNSLLSVRPPTEENNLFLQSYLPKTDYYQKYGESPDALNFNVDGSKGDTTNLAIEYRDFLNLRGELADLKADVPLRRMDVFQIPKNQRHEHNIYLKHLLKDIDYRSHQILIHRKCSFYILLHLHHSGLYKFHSQLICTVRYFHISDIFPMKYFS